MGLMPLTPTPPPAPKRLQHPEIVNHQLCGLETLHWDNFDIQYLHRNCCNVLRKEQLETIHRKLRGACGNSVDPDFGVDFAKLASRTEWVATNTLLAISGQYDRANDVIQCGHGRHRCKEAGLCPRCSFLRGTDLVQEFGTLRWDRAAYYVVFSFDNESKRLILNGCDLASRTGTGTTRSSGTSKWLPVSSDLPKAAKLIWSIGRDALRVRAKELGFCGGLVSPELAVRFNRLRFLPHSNAFVWTENAIDEDVWWKVLESYSNTIRKVPECSALFGSVSIRSVQSSEHLAQLLRYSTKAIAIAEEYAATAEQSKNDPESMRSLNREVCELFKILPRCFSYVPRPVYLGGCRKASANYFGYETEYRRRLREKNAARLKSKPPRKRPGSKKKWKPRKSTYQYYEQISKTKFTVPKF
jgi:hypothetical protein